jgi:hypothetical protein
MQLKLEEMMELNNASFIFDEVSYESRQILKIITITTTTNQNKIKKNSNDKQFPSSPANKAQIDVENSRELREDQSQPLLAQVGAANCRHEDRQEEQQSEEVTKAQECQSAVAQQSHSSSDEATGSGS